MPGDSSDQSILCDGRDLGLLLLRFTCSLNLNHWSLTERALAVKPRHFFVAARLLGVGYGVALTAGADATRLDLLLACVLWDTQIIEVSLGARLNGLLVQAERVRC